MQDEPTDNLSGTDETETGVENAPPKTEPPKTEPPKTTDPDVKQPPDDSSGKQEPPPRQQPEPVEKPNPVIKYIDDSQVEIVTDIAGSHNTAFANSIKINLKDESHQSLDVFVRVSSLDAPCRTYKSLEEENVIGYSGCLRTERIILVSCHDEDVALSVAKIIAYEANVPSKELVSIDETAQGRYNFRNLIDALPRAKEKRPAPPAAPVAIYVWDADNITDDEISTGILNSLLSGKARIEQYKHWLAEHGLCLICIVPPQRVHTYNDLHFESLRSLHIDFLSPLIEHYHEDQYESLVCTIRQQRAEGRWSENDVEFYRQIYKHLAQRNLSEAIQERMNPESPDRVIVEHFFNRQDPLIDTVLYCATFFRDLSPQDFSYLVELFLGETTEEVTRRVTRLQPGKENDVTEVVESLPLVRRWRREADAIRRGCKLATVKKKDGRLVVDFQVDGLRPRVREYIRKENYFFYESNFVFLRQQGLLLSPKKAIAEGARQIFVEVAMHYAPNEVAAWLYEIIHEFEELTQAKEQRFEDVTPRFQLLPDLRVRVARRYVAYGLSRVLLRLDKADEVREAVRLFWQKLVQTKPQWFLDVLRRMGDSTPPDTLKWLRQLLDQVRDDDIRRQVRVYLVIYLLHKESAVYPSLKELMQWPKSTHAGRVAREVLVLYCAEANRQLEQRDYGKWPTPHPLFAFQSRSEAEECLELLVGWVCTAASEVDEDNALFIVADIFAGWYFILSSSPSDAGNLSGEADLSSQIVRDLLFQRLTGNSPRIQKNTLTAIWDRLRNDILDEVIELDEFVNKITIVAPPSAELLADAAKVRRKLLDTRASLNELRKVFIEWTAEKIPA